MELDNAMMLHHTTYVAGGHINDEMIQNMKTAATDLMKLSKTAALKVKAWQGSFGV